MKGLQGTCIMFRGLLPVSTVWTHVTRSPLWPPFLVLRGVLNVLVGVASASGMSPTTRGTFFPLNIWSHLKKFRVSDIYSNGNHFCALPPL